MIYLDIINNTGYKVVREEIAGVIEKVLAEKGIPEDVELAVTLVDEMGIRELHRKFMGSDETTDVLSFPLEVETFPDGIRRLGDIVVCLPVAQKQALENKRSEQQEINFLIEHGLRHLLGENHE